MQTFYSDRIDGLCVSDMEKEMGNAHSYPLPPVNSICKCLIMCYKNNDFFFSPPRLRM